MTFVIILCIAPITRQADKTNEGERSAAQFVGCSCPSSPVVIANCSPVV